MNLKTPTFETLNFDHDCFTIVKHWVLLLARRNFHNELCMVRTKIKIMEQALQCQKDVQIRRQFHQHEQNKRCACWYSFC
jgi:hypothetical protein